MERYYVEVTPLTAAHIGTGYEISPFEYTIKKIDGKLKFIRFSTEVLINYLSPDERGKLMNFIERNDIISLRAFFADKADENNSEYLTDVTKELCSLYFKKLDDINNQLIVDEMYRCKADHQPVIPGSSIKGAIRTAIISKIAKDKDENEVFNIYSDRRENKQVKKFKGENNILRYNDAKNDPFRAVRITDCNIVGKDTEIVCQITNFKENRAKSDDFSKMQMFKELIKGELLEGDAHGVFEISFDDQLQKINKRVDGWKPIEFSISKDDIIKDCNNFYKHNFHNEYRKFYEKTRYEEIKSSANDLKGIIDNIDETKNECLIRLGKHSHVENVTIEKHRDPWNEVHGKTRNLTEFKGNYYPLGWVKLRFLKSGEASEILNRINELEKQKMMKIQLKEEKAEKERLELIRLKEREEQQQQLEEARKKAEEERLKAIDEKIANLKPDNPVDESKIIEIDKLINAQDISIFVNECVKGNYGLVVLKRLKERLQEFGEWEPSGKKSRKKRIQKNKDKIEKRINELINKLKEETLNA